MCHEKLYRSDATSQTEAEILDPPRQQAPVPAEMEVGAFDNEEDYSTESSESSNDDED